MGRDGNGSNNRRNRTMNKEKPEYIRNILPGDKITIQFNRHGELWFIPINTEWNEKEETTRNNIRDK